MPASTYQEVKNSTPAVMSAPALSRVLSNMGVSRDEFCSQREAEYQVLVPQSVIKSFCSSGEKVDRNRLVRKGSIANGKLDGTNLAKYWNLEKAPSKDNGSAVA